MGLKLTTLRSRVVYWLNQPDAPTISLVFKSHSSECIVVFHYSFNLYFPNDQRYCVSLHVLICYLYIFFGKISVEMFCPFKKLACLGCLVAQLVKHLTSAQVMISQFMGSGPALGSVQTAQSLEPASDSVSPLSLPHPCSCSVSQ